MDEGSKMDDLRTRAQLVGRDRAGAIGIVLERAEIAEAAAGIEFPATLLLEIERGDEAQARVAVDWDRETLEQLLASTEDEELGLWFDENELALAFDDVEGHGLREKTAVLAVAVVAAGASTTPAFARMQAEPGGAGGAGATPTAVAPNPAGDKHAVMTGAERALQQDRSLSQNLSSANAAATSSSSSTLSTGELAGAVAGGALLIAAAGFGVAKRRATPVQPA
jgi:hypothetical protein